LLNHTQGLKTLRDNTLVETIRACVHPHPKPCVNISGGIDSAIVLHHLAEKSKEEIYTYTVGFANQDTEFDYARQLSEHYATRHKEILIERLLDTYPEILSFFERPQFNLWPYWAAQQAKEDGRLNCYIGEGGDEHFGGYWYKPPTSYPEQWAHLFSFVDPAYRTIYKHFNIGLHTPLHPSNLRFTVTYPYYDHDQEKRFVKDAYRGILPDFVLDRRKLNGRKDYWQIWQHELKQYYPNQKPQSEEDIQNLWNLWVTKEWLKSHDIPEVVELIAQTH
jgi:asparagine synthetase B (glutamine-hydrolysing)